jgi:hypothetical protein
VVEKTVVSGFLALFGAVVVGCSAGGGCVGSTQGSMSHRYVDNPRNVNHLLNSVVALVEENPINGNLMGPTCTAFYISPRELATANHCVEDSGVTLVEIIPGLVVAIPGEGPTEETVGRRILFVNRAEYESWLPDGSRERPSIQAARVVVVDVTNDIAIMELEGSEPDSTEWLRLSPEDPRVADRVYAAGMPAGQPWVLTDGMVNAIRMTRSGKRSILHDTHIAGGSSGSPLVNELGLVVGVNVAGINETDIYIATPGVQLVQMYRDLHRPSKRVVN